MPPSVTRSHAIIDVACETAGEFLEILDPIAGSFASAPRRNDYVFRGVSSQSYELIPTVFRSTAESHVAGVQVFPAESVIEQCQAEHTILEEFFHIASRHGLRLPEDSQQLRTALEEWAWRLTEFEIRGQRETIPPLVWPPTEFYSLIALAQHNGVPTRALDWTWSSLIAAYFGASSAQARSNDKVVVWVFSYSAEEFQRAITGPPRDRPMVIYSASGADNANLRAQQGLFMLHPQRVTSPTAPFVVPRYDELLRLSLTAVRRMIVIYRVSVPSSEAYSVLAGVAAAGVTAGALFPGFGGVAREMREQKFLRANVSRRRTTDAARHVATEIHRLNDIPAHGLPEPPLP